MAVVSLLTETPSKLVRSEINTQKSKEISLEVGQKKVDESKRSSKFVQTQTADTFRANLGNF